MTSSPQNHLEMRSNDQDREVKVQRRALKSEKQLVEILPSGSPHAKTLRIALG